MGSLAALENIRQRADRCRLCPCALSRKQVVIYRGVSEPRVLFVGQSPGARENEMGQPFVGPAGRLLEDATKVYHIDSYGCINVINCFPPMNKYREVYGKACQPFLVEKLKALIPSVRHLVVLGLDAHAIIGLVQQAQPGLFASLKVHYIIHPAAVLRNGSWNSRWADGWAKLEKAVNGNS
jgi:uracil-DNA glycosylase